MIIFMWSGPRNLSTALMRSFENRDDTEILDEPFYAYYLDKTNLRHPMYKEIINSYPKNENTIIKDLFNIPNNSEIYYQKHMTHHLLDISNLEWLNKGKNCFLIRRIFLIRLASVVVVVGEKNANKSNEAHRSGRSCKLCWF